jgi:hypothetical protein
MNRHKLPFDAALQEIEALKQKPARLSKKEQQRRQAELNRKKNAQRKATVARIIASDPVPGYSMGPKVTVVGKVDLPEGFMKKGAPVPKEKKPVAAKAAPQPAPKKKKAKEPPPPAGLRQLWKQQKGICYYCFAPASLPQETGNLYAEDSATIEHIYPRNDIRRNLLTEAELRVMACFRCNQEANKLFYDGLQHQYKIENRILPRVPRFVELLTQNI